MHDTRRTRLVLAGLLIAAIGLIAVNYADGSNSMMGGIKRVSGSVFGGIEHAVSAVAGFFGAGSGGGADSGKVAALQQQVIRLRAALSQAELSRSDYRQLRRLLELSGKGGYRVVAASVIAFGQGYQQTVTLDAGSADGVAPQQTVLDGQGLVGKVTSVTPHTATVLLATDASSIIGVRLAPSGAVGWVTGRGKGATGPTVLRLRVLNTTAAVTPGEQLVTSASVRDRPFVPGVPVGVISKIIATAGGLTPLALVRPYANFGALNVVGIVIQPPRHNPHFAVLPPRPGARPTPTVTVTVTPGATPSPAASPSAGG